MDDESLLVLAFIISILPICISVYLLHGLLSTNSEKERFTIKNVLLMWYGLTFIIGTIIYFIPFLNIPYILSLSVVWFLLMLCLS